MVTDLLHSPLGREGAGRCVWWGSVSRDPGRVGGYGRWFLMDWSTTYQMM